MLRAVFYARCSTEEESQQDALEQQVWEAENCIIQQKWILVDRYVESKSGTSTKGRKEYNRLYEDIFADKFDVIVIKSQDRLMRNVKDWYIFLDALTTNKKKLFMYIENKYYDPDDALITGIKAILAEDYSRELSKKINNAHKNRQKYSGNPIIHGNVYGFKRLPDKSIVLVEEEAAVIHRMYELAAAGYGGRTISNILKNEEITGRSGKYMNPHTIIRMLKNPMNKGVVVMNKMHFDFTTKQMIHIPKDQWYVHENKVPRIVSDELWELANQKICERTNKKTRDNAATKGKNPGKYPFSGKLICGICGEPYYRGARRRYRDHTIIYEWKCKSYIELGRNKDNRARPQMRKVELNTLDGCDNVYLDEQRLNKLLEEFYTKHYQVDKDKIIEDMLVILKDVLKENNLQSELEKEQVLLTKAKKQLAILVDKLLDGVISNEVYSQKQSQLEETIRNIQDRIDDLEEQENCKTALNDRILKIESSLRNEDFMEQATVSNMLDEIDKIFVYRDHMDIHFSTEIIRIDYGNLFDYAGSKKEEREKIVDILRENPYATAKMIAEQLGMSLSGVNGRIRILKQEGRIYYDGKGGNGKWIVNK